MDFSAEEKTEIERKIVDTIVLALENGNLSQEELPDVADFVLEKIKLVKTKEELINFLTELATNWQIFANIKDITEGEVKERKEDKAYGDVLNLAKGGNIEEALKLAKTVTNK